MSKKVLSLIIILASLSVILVIVFLSYRDYRGEKFQNSQERAGELDLTKEKTHLSKVGDTENAYWKRGLPFLWNNIEEKEGKFDWSSIDEALETGEIHLATIWPYANWDQVVCHTDEKYRASKSEGYGGILKESEEDLLMGKPCDMGSYSNFLEKAVERYDGDGINDMPGLKTPIKYWEIINEPETQSNDLKFFVGTPQEYFEILKSSHEIIKKADPGAKVVQGGMAGMHDQFLEFWTPIFDLGAGEYFDIANMHSISTTEMQEDLYVIRFKEFLGRYGLQDKPIWLTEVQFGDLQKRPEDLEEFNRLFVRASVFALAQGAEKLFYIENWLHWRDYKEELETSSTQKVYLNLVTKINSFDRIEIIEEKYTEGEEDWQGATSVVGQYKFIDGDNIIFVLWGETELPAEISGMVNITDIYGNTQRIDSVQIELSDSPVFVEKL